MDLNRMSLELTRIAGELYSLASEHAKLVSANDEDRRQPVASAPVESVAPEAPPAAQEEPEAPQAVEQLKEPATPAATATLEEHDDGFNPSKAFKIGKDGDTITLPVAATIWYGLEAGPFALKQFLIPGPIALTDETFGYQAGEGPRSAYVTDLAAVPYPNPDGR